MYREAVEAIGGLEKWAKQCHQASIALVRTGKLPDGARVARGWHPAVMGAQHSWVVIGSPYEKGSALLDPTLWHYADTAPVMAIDMVGETQHRPHGWGSIWDYGRPDDPTGEIITLDADLSPRALSFLNLAGPDGLDRQGWNFLANAPVGGWPAAEIIGAMYDDERLSCLIPIDIVGMLTDRNPGNLYW